MDSTEAVIQGATAIVALAALGTAVWEGVVTRRHNRLSVQPHLSISHHLAGSRGRFGLTVSNDGLGPALVTGCVVEVDGQPMKEDGGNGWEAAITTIGLRGRDLNFTTIAPDGVIRAGDYVWLLWTPATDETKRQISEVTVAFRRLCVRISYESMYRSRGVATYGIPRAARTG